MAPEFTAGGDEAMSTASTTDKHVSTAARSRHEQTELRIVVSPAFDQSGRRRHEKFEARLSGDSQVLCVSRQPLLDAARALLKHRMEPSTVLAMVHAGNPSVVAIKSPIGVAAARDVMGTRFVHRKTCPVPMPASVARSRETGVSDLPEPEFRTVGASDKRRGGRSPATSGRPIAHSNTSGGYARCKVALT